MKVPGSRLLRHTLAAALALAALLFNVTSARAVILLGDGNPATNTTAPTGALAGSGWQYEGTFGSFLGTPIAPQFFITAKHVGGASTKLDYNGASYNVVRAFADPFSDLIVWQVDGVFPSFAPLYTSGGETGQPLVVIGRGTQRGGEVNLGYLRGWYWGAGDGVQRWGQNFVSEIISDGPLNQYVYASFDAAGAPNEAHLSSGDSGGAVFIQEARTWKLAGINYAVDGPFFNTPTGGGEFNATMTDARGFYYKDSDNPPHFTQVTGATAVPTGFYATRISAKLAWINSIIAPAGDVNGDGVSNLVEFARVLNSPAPEGLGLPSVTQEGSALAITFRKLQRTTSPVYAVQKADDLSGWTTVPATETSLGTNGDVQTVKAVVPLPAGGTQMFLRVQIAAP